MDDPFYIETDAINNGPGVLGSLRVRVLMREPARTHQIGEYIRYLPSAYHTFCPFKQDGRWFALFSGDYTITEVMELPTCKRIAAEKSSSHGFCPVDFYVPFDDPRVMASGQAGHFGFVAGCIWGDDSSWKIQHLDLSQIASGRIVRSERFGYIEMPNEMTRLSDCISFQEYSPPNSSAITVRIAAPAYLDMVTGLPYGPV